MDRTRPVTQVEVEAKIVALTGRLEALTEDFAEAAEADARSEARWKHLFHTALLDVLNTGETGRGERFGDARAREAEARRLCQNRRWVARALALSADDLGDDVDPYGVHLIHAAAKESTKEALRTTAAALSAQQTLLRSLTDNLT